MWGRLWEKLAEYRRKLLALLRAMVPEQGA
jgi:hypothetical protein